MLSDGYMLAPTALARRCAAPRSAGRQKFRLQEWKPLVSVTAYHSFGGEVEARIPALVPSSTFEHSSSARASARMQVSRSSGCSFVRRSSANSVVSDSPIRRRCTPILFPAILGLQLGALNKVG